MKTLKDIEARLAQIKNEQNIQSPAHVEKSLNRNIILKKLKIASLFIAFKIFDHYLLFSQSVLKLSTLGGIRNTNRSSVNV